MAWITAIDCERVVPNPFALVLLAAARARALNRGDAPRVPPDGDAPTVIALREIAAGVADQIRPPLVRPTRFEILPPRFGPR
jgi:DNA-directed RNA polymerase subunit omega